MSSVNPNASREELLAELEFAESMVLTSKLIWFAGHRHSMFLKRDLTESALKQLDKFPSNTDLIPAREHLQLSQTADTEQTKDLCLREAWKIVFNIMEALGADCSVPN